MSKVQLELSANELRLVASALRFVFEEIEDDLRFEDRIGATRWAAEELNEAINAVLKTKT